MPPLFDSWPQKNDFGDEALMGPFYRKLKSEVKDELHKVDRPDNLSEYIAMAAKIDERRHERRREKAEEKRQPRGANFNPHFPNQHRQQGSSQRNLRQQ